MMAKVATKEIEEGTKANSGRRTGQNGGKAPAHQLSVRKRKHIAKAGRRL